MKTSAKSSSACGKLPGSGPPRTAPNATPSRWRATIIKPERQWRHLNVCQLESAIVCALPRGRCRECQAVFQVKPPWEGRSKHFTQEFEGFALLLAREMPVSKAGEILGETDQRLWRMLFAHIQAAHAQLSMEEVVWGGADEMNCKKGHHYLTVFVDLLAKRVLFATAGKDATTWEAFATALLAHNGHPKAVTQAAIDMSPAYRKGVAEHFGNATVSFDKFHVVGQVVEAVDEVRRAERTQPERGNCWRRRGGCFGRTRRTGRPRKEPAGRSWPKRI